MSERIGIIGGGGQADEAESFSTREVAFRAVEKPYVNDHARIDIEDPGELVDYPVVFAVGAPGLRRRLVQLWPGNNYTKVISRSSYIDDSSDIKEGVIIAPSAVITTNVIIGAHALINVGASVQHDSVIGDFVTVSPGARIGGNVDIGDGVFVGMGASIIQRVRIASGIVIGAGATVMADLLEENGVYVGTPAKLVKRNEGWIHEL